MFEKIHLGAYDKPLYANKAALQAAKIHPSVLEVSYIVGNTKLELIRVSSSQAAMASSNEGTVFWGLNGGKAEFPTREAMLAASPFPQGTRVTVKGVTYTVDASQTDFASALWDIDVPGYSADMPRNMFIMTVFDQAAVGRNVRIYVSPDAQQWRLLNAINTPTSGPTMAGGNPSIIWHKGKWLIIVEWQVMGQRDFMVYRSSDLITWESINCMFGPTQVFSNTVPAPGANVPCDKVWGADMFSNPVTGELWVMCSLPYRPNEADTFGEVVPNFRIYVSKCNDDNKLTFDGPQLLLPGGDDFNMIDANIIRFGTNLWLTVKDERNKEIRFYSGKNVMGPWTYDNKISDPKYKIEGSTLLPQFIELGGKVLVDVYMFVDAHNDKSGARSISMFRYSKRAPIAGGGFSARVRPDFTRPVRHGGGLNLGYVDREAMLTVQRASGALLGDGPKRNDIELKIETPSRIVYPQQDCVYYIEGDIATTLTLDDGPAESFYILIASGLATSSITITSNSYFRRARTWTGDVHGDRLIEIRRRPNGAWYPTS